MRITVDPDAVEGALVEYLRTAGDGQPEVAAARAHHALPFWRDIGGCLLLQPNGTILGLEWDNPSLVDSVADTPRDRKLVHAARASAAERFPDISGLRPERGPDVKICPSCGGTGRLTRFGEPPVNVVCECGGLGWIPE